MKRYILLLLLLAVSVFVIWRFVFQKDKKPETPEPVGLAVSEHSSDFNESLKDMLETYYQLTESFVNWDTAGIVHHTGLLQTAIDSLKLREMQEDSLIYPTVESYWGMIRSELQGMQADADIYEKREDLNMLSQEIFDLLRTVKYDASVVYYNESPKALNNYETPAFWLSPSSGEENRRNPYHGLQDPKYGNSMLNSGETKDSVGYITQSSNIN